MSKRQKRQSDRQIETRTRKNKRRDFLNSLFQILLSFVNKKKKNDEKKMKDILYCENKG